MLLTKFFNATFPVIYHNTKNEHHMYVCERFPMCQPRQSLSDFYRWNHENTGAEKTSA